MADQRAASRHVNRCLTQESEQSKHAVGTAGSRIGLMNYCLCGQFIAFKYGHLWCCDHTRTERQLILNETADSGDQAWRFTPCMSCARGRHENDTEVCDCMRAVPSECRLLERTRCTTAQNTLLATRTIVPLYETCRWLLWLGFSLDS